MEIQTAENEAYGAGTPRIAVPVSAGSEEGLVRRVEEARAAGADIIEIRADAWPQLQEGACIGRMLTAAKKAAGSAKLLFTIRTRPEGGQAELDDEAYLLAVKTAIISGTVDLVDIEYRRAAAPALIEAARASHVKTVLSGHDFHATPSEDEILHRLLTMEHMGGDIAKLACMPEEDRDVTRMCLAAARARLQMKIPTVTISMGEKGIVTRLAGEIFGSAFTFGCLDGEESAPGQIPVGRLRQKLEEVHRLREQGPFIFLIGFMGTGKSTIGEALSEKTSLPLCEMDARIAARDGRTIPEIFEKDGEEYFRDLETRELIRLYEEGRGIVSCGGGLALREGNRALMRCLGRTVLLTAEPKTILARLSGQAAGRPNLKNRMTEEGIRTLMEKRRSAYEAAGEIVVATDGKSVDEICGEILARCSR
ncbi:MAG: type I 3-dehydroquinate dehydratase [Eubacteriales bacterium]|jgi:3-dehydroquinate dehydratase type I|nr:type I 3-dehydroquinate dehydratase [Eubacteriales bacterium]